MIILPKIVFKQTSKGQNNCRGQFGALKTSDFFKEDFGIQKWLSQNIS